MTSAPPGHPLHELESRLHPQPAAPSQPPAPGPPALTREQMQAQLLTLERYGEEAARARALGGPSGGLAALLRQPITCGPFTLYPLTMSVFIYLRAIGSPLVGEGGGEVSMEDMTRALLGFTGPENAAAFLTFDAAGVHADMAAVHRAAWQLAAQLTSRDIADASDWVASQMTDVAGLLPAGEEAENFPTPPGTTAVTAPPEATLPPPAPPAGSL